MTNTDFSPKSEIHLNESKADGKKLGEAPVFLDQSLAESDNESENTEIQNQIDKLMLGEWDWEPLIDLINKFGSYCEQSKLVSIINIMDK